MQGLGVVVACLLLVVVLAAVMILPGAMGDWRAGREAESRARIAEAEEYTERVVAGYEHTETMAQTFVLSLAALTHSPVSLVVAGLVTILIVWWLRQPVQMPPR